MNQTIKSICLHGFNTKEQIEAFRKLESLKLIDIKLWISDDKNSNISIRDINRLNFTINSNYKAYDNIYNEIEDKYLQKFIDMFARERYVNATYHEYKNIFSLYYSLFSEYLEKFNFDLIIFSNLPHFGADLILYILSKRLGIKTLITHQSHFPNRFYLLDDIENYGNFLDVKSEHQNKIAFEKIKPSFKKHHFYMTKSRVNFATCLKPLLLKDIKMGLKRKRGMRVPFAFTNFIKCRQFQKKLNSIKNNNIDFSKKYVYFALHLQPELTTSAIGGRYSDQIRAIEELREMLPDDYFIYVKENPKQTWYQRDEFFFKRLNAIFNVIYLSNSVNTYDLIEHSQFVSTISGTVGWESISGGKNVLIFANSWYQNFPGAFLYNDKITLSKILNFRISHDELENTYNRHLNQKTYCGVVDENYKAIIKEYHYKDGVENLTKSLKFIISDNL